MKINITFIIIFLFSMSFSIIFNSCDETEEPDQDVSGPSAPTLIYPEDEANDVLTFDELRWSYPLGGIEEDPVKFNIYLDESQNPSSMLASGLNQRTFELSLTPNETYYWKVVADAGKYGQKESEVRSFTTINTNPQDVTLSYPTNGSVDIPVDARLTWQQAEDPDGFQVLYDFYFGEDESTLSLISADQTQLSYLPQLSPNTTYYWKVIVKDPHDGSSESPVWSFTTIDDSPVDIDYLTFADDRVGGQGEFLAVDINGQIWMAENLAYLPSVGSSIRVYDYEGSNVDDAKLTENYKKYGALYTWIEATDGGYTSNDIPSGVQGVCPAGWHMPSRAEWNLLRDFIIAEGNTAIGTVLKSRTDDWYDDGHGTDKYGFGGLPGGQYYNGEFTLLGMYGYYWTTGAYVESTAWYRDLSYRSTGMGQGVAYNDQYWFSVRCIKD